MHRQRIRRVVQRYPEVVLLVTVVALGAAVVRLAAIGADLFDRIGRPWPSWVGVVAVVGFALWIALRLDDDR